MPPTLIRGRWSFLRLAALIVALATLAACSPNNQTAGTTSAPQAAAKPGKLVIAVQPSATPDSLSADAKELEKFLSARMGREVEIIFPTSFAGVIEALRFGHAHAAFMSAWPLALAQKTAGAEIALAEVREVVIGQDKQEQPYYFSYWIVRKDSPITSLDQLRGKKVALPSPLSTSGYVAPVGHLVETGLLQTDGKEADPKKFFGEVVLAGGYAQGWEALKAGQVDATVMAGDVSEKLYREALDNSRVIAQQGPVPSHGVAFAKQLDAQSRQQLRDALLALGEPEHRPLMRKFISGIFVSFRTTTAEEHLASLNRYLSLTKLEYVERLK